MSGAVSGAIAGATSGATRILWPEFLIVALAYIIIAVLWWHSMRRK